MLGNPVSRYDYQSGYSQPGGMMGGPSGRMGPEYAYPYGVSDIDPELTDFDSNGEMIYYTGYNESGQKIPFSYGPTWLSVRGGSCVSCHGVDGRGGVPVMMAYEIPSDITYESLTSEEHDMEEGEGHPPYTNETIKIAIREGIDPSGDELDPVMPRWHMSDEDLDDLIEYLRGL
ncbi:hypothetical protein CUN85_00745 [Methanolobus halotolerans]|uniref:Cytochrome c domain-containing protein n=2 Tax=Methanolobus halotolerans TaxID=2052935 RepID=A0A4E0Q0N4_9EURY|nr:hypothetical protein CUN85_00745 [Methanolobus halotolerans]